MRKALLIVIFGVIAFGMTCEESCGGSNKSITYQYQCASNNESLYFIMYERDGDIYGGHMYIEKMQVADLTLDAILSEGNLVVRVKGNAADVKINLSPDRILINHSPTQTTSQVCKCSYRKL